MRNLLVLASFLVLLARPAPAQELVAFDVEEFGGVRALRGELFQPPGTGPFGAVILLHDCDGPNEHHRIWAKRLQEWGYVALVIDTFGYRRITEVCSRPLNRYAGIWGRDAKGARDFLVTRTFVSPVRIGVMAWGYGGLGALEAARPEPPSLRAAVAFYPPCGGPVKGPFETPLLILSGGADAWTPAGDCQRLTQEAGEPKAEVVVYPGALHGFDIERRPSEMFGHRIAPDRVATADTIERIRRFLDQRLRTSGPTPEPPAPQGKR
jgi:dienelactone hydrolase